MCRLDDYYIGQIIDTNFDIDVNCEVCGSSRINGVHRIKFVGHGQCTTCHISSYGDIFDFVDRDVVCPSCHKAFTAFIERCDKNRYLNDDSYFVGIPILLPDLVEVEKEIQNEHQRSVLRERLLR